MRLRYGKRPNCLSVSEFSVFFHGFSRGVAYFRIFSPGSRFFNPDTKSLSRIYARYFCNTGRYLSPSPAEHAACVQLILGKSSGMFYNRKEKLCSGGQKE